jgi:hypothetical protein
MARRQPYSRVRNSCTAATAPGRWPQSRPQSRRRAAAEPEGWVDGSCAVVCLWGGVGLLGVRV